MNFYKIGQKISDARIRNNMTQEELAEQLNITPSFLSNIETAKRKPSLNTLLSLADKLSLSLDYIFYDRDIKEDMHQDIIIRQIYTQIDKLEDSKREKFLDIIDYLAKKL